MKGQVVGVAKSVWIKICCQGVEREVGEEGRVRGGGGRVVWKGEREEGGESVGGWEGGGGGGGEGGREREGGRGWEIL